MAKAKNEPVRGELVIENELVKNPDYQLDKDDVVAITLSEAEGQCRAEIQRLTNSLKAATTTVTASRKVAVEAIDEKAKHVAGKTLARAKRALESLVEMVVSAQCYDARNMVEAIADGNLTVKFQMSLTDPKGRAGALQFRDQEYVADAAIQQLCQKAVADAKEVLRLNEELFGWQSKLADLPTFERTVKAEIARHRLAKSTQGQEILGVMNRVLKDRFLGLPAPESK